MPVELKDTLVIGISSKKRCPSPTSNSPTKATDSPAPKTGLPVRCRRGKHRDTHPETPWALETQTLDGHYYFSAPPAAFRNRLARLFGDVESAGSARQR
jgi:hypothetical protein